MVVKITYFDIAPKIEYDQGDINFILILKYSSAVEIVPSILHDSKFICGTTIKHLVTSIVNYPTGIIFSTVVARHRKDTQNVLDIKDGYDDIEKVAVRPST